MNHAVTILVVDDSPEDFEAAARGFRRAGLRGHLVHCVDGDEALEYLHREGAWEDPEKSPRPLVILLDLNMPGTDGHEVLRVVKGDPELRSIPVVVLTTSTDERDIRACYAAGANSYVQKPVDLDGFLQTIERLKQYWLEIALLPGDE